VQDPATSPLCALHDAVGGESPRPPPNAIPRLDRHPRVFSTPLRRVGPLASRARHPSRRLPPDNHSLAPRRRPRAFRASPRPSVPSARALKALLLDDFSACCLEQMPGARRVEASRADQSPIALAALPIIFVTALSKEGDKHVYRCYSAAPSDYIFKPVALRSSRSTVLVFVSCGRRRHHSGHTRRISCTPRSSPRSDARSEERYIPGISPMQCRRSFGTFRRPRGANVFTAAGSRYTGMALAPSRSNAWPSRRVHFPADLPVAVSRREATLASGDTFDVGTASATGTASTAFISAEQFRSITMQRDRLPGSATSNRHPRHCRLTMDQRAFLSVAATHSPIRSTTGKRSLRSRRSPRTAARRPGVGARRRSRRSLLRGRGRARRCHELTSLASCRALSPRTRLLRPESPQ